MSMALLGCYGDCCYVVPIKGIYQISMNEVNIYRLIIVFHLSQNFTFKQGSWCIYIICYDVDVEFHFCN